MSGDYFPHRAIGLTANPFRVLEPQELRAVTVVPEAVRAACDAPGHVQIVGDAGRGKTTLLRALAASLADAGRAVVYEYVPEGARSYRTRVSRLEVLLLDEADRLATGSWRRLLGELRSRETRLIFSAHRDQSRRFARKRLALGTVIPARLLDREQLARILTARIEPCKLPGVPGPSLSPAAIDWLVARFGSDLRALESFLFDFFQSLREATAIDPDELATFERRRQTR